MHKETMGYEGDANRVSGVIVNENGPGALAGAAEAEIKKEHASAFLGDQYGNVASIAIERARALAKEIAPPFSAIQGALDVLLEALDEADGDPDFEPSLGSIAADPAGQWIDNTSRCGSQEFWSEGGTGWRAHDLEEQCDDEGNDGGDFELDECGVDRPADWGGLYDLRDIYRMAALWRARNLGTPIPPDLIAEDDGSLSVFGRPVQSVAVDWNLGRAR